MRKWIYFLFVICASCQPHSVQEFHLHGQELVHAFVQDLQQLQTQQDFFRKKRCIEKHFCNIAKAILQAKAFKEHYPDQMLFEEIYPSSYSYELYKELVRIEQMPGGKQFIEETREKALQILQEEKC